MKRTRALMLPVAIAAFAGLSASWALAGDAAGPFTALVGSWSGNGTLTMTDGTKERIRCGVQYVVNKGGDNLQQSLRCSSNSYNFHVNAFVKNADGALSGNWNDTSNNVTGSITGQASDVRISIDVAAGNAFSAKMLMLTQGQSQTVTIEPKGGTDVTVLSITMNKGP